jgi:hypothetical protein
VVLGQRDGSASTGDPRRKADEQQERANWKGCEAPGWGRGGGYVLNTKAEREVGRKPLLGKGGRTERPVQAGAAESPEPIRLLRHATCHRGDQLVSCLSIERTVDVARRHLGNPSPTSQLHKVDIACR